jgi:hypothetical protein
MLQTRRRVLIRLDQIRVQHHVVKSLHDSAPLSVLECPRAYSDNLGRIAHCWAIRCLPGLGRAWLRGCVRAGGRKRPTDQLRAASHWSTGRTGCDHRVRRVPTRDTSHVARPSAVAVPHVALLIGRALPAATIGYTCSCFSTYASSSTGPSAPHRTAPRRAAPPRAHDVGGGLHTARARWLHRGGARTVRGGRGGGGGGGGGG